MQEESTQCEHVVLLDVLNIITKASGNSCFKGARWGHATATVHLNDFVFKEPTGELIRLFFI
jgi:hypothetical protein